MFGTTLLLSQGPLWLCRPGGSQWRFSRAVETKVYPRSPFWCGQVWIVFYPSGSGYLSVFSNHWKSSSSWSFMFLWHLTDIPLLSKGYITLFESCVCLLSYVVQQWCLISPVKTDNKLAFTSELSSWCLLLKQRSKMYLSYCSCCTHQRGKILLSWRKAGFHRESKLGLVGGVVGHTFQREPTNSFTQMFLYICHIWYICHICDISQIWKAGCSWSWGSATPLKMNQMLLLGPVLRCSLWITTS